MTGRGRLPPLLMEQDIADFLGVDLDWLRCHWPDLWRRGLPRPIYLSRGDPVVKRWDPLAIELWLARLRRPGRVRLSMPAEIAAPAQPTTEPESAADPPLRARKNRRAEAEATASPAELLAGMQAHWAERDLVRAGVLKLPAIAPAAPAIDDRRSSKRRGRA